MITDGGPTPIILKPYNVRVIPAGSEPEPPSRTAARTRTRVPPGPGPAVTVAAAHSGRRRDRDREGPRLLDRPGNSTQRDGCWPGPARTGARWARYRGPAQSVTVHAPLSLSRKAAAGAKAKLLANLIALAQRPWPLPGGTPAPSVQVTSTPLLR
jgi:hypothetical protein